MKKLFVYASLLAIVATFVSCGDSITLSYDYDKENDFTEYRSFGFLQWPEENNKLLTEFDKNRILESTTEEFKARGMTFKENVQEADIAVNIFVTAEQKTEQQAYTNYYGGGSGYYYNPYMGMGSSTTTVREVNYIVGSIIVDVFDVKEKKLVWQGIGQGVVDDQPKNPEENTDKVMEKIIGQYPVPKAGR